MKAGWSKGDRRRFDEILEGVLAELPEQVRGLLEEAPLVVDDFPSDALLAELGLDPLLDDLCGLHTGSALTERSVTHSGEIPDHIQIFRRGILDAAQEGCGAIDAAANDEALRAAVAKEIRITILHELGHHFGLSEGDLDRLGYG